MKEEKVKIRPTMCTYNDRGEEILDPDPVALPVGFSRPKSLQETMRHLLRNELIRRELDASGIETFEEADDFDTGEDDPLGNTPYEDDFEPEVPGLVAREQEIRAGAVRDIPLEKKEKARETIRNYSRPKHGNGRKHSSATSGSSSEDDDDATNRPSLSARSKGGVKRNKEADQMDSDGDESIDE